MRVNNLFHLLIRAQKKEEKKKTVKRLKKETHQSFLVTYLLSI